MQKVTLDHAAIASRKAVKDYWDKWDNLNFINTEIDLNLLAMSKLVKINKFKKHSIKNNNWLLLKITENKLILLKNWLNQSK